MITICYKANSEGGLDIRAFGKTFPVKDNFKAHGYKWDGEYWRKTVSGAPEDLKAEAMWIKSELTRFQVVKG